MTGLQFIRLLKLSGTGESKLCFARQALAAHPQATPHDLAEALETAGTDSGVGQVTIEKAQLIAAGSYQWPEFPGHPEWYERQAERILADQGVEKITGAMMETAADAVPSDRLSDLVEDRPDPDEPPQSHHVPAHKGRGKSKSQAEPNEAK